jgi:hypothetical protein
MDEKSNRDDSADVDADAMMARQAKMLRPVPAECTTVSEMSCVEAWLIRHAIHKWRAERHT